MKPEILLGIFSVFAPLSLTAQAPDNPRPPIGQINDRGIDNFKELQGSWIVARATMNGKESHDRTLLEGIWRFRGNELTLASRQKGNVSTLPASRVAGS
jgi:hypothetical protein